MENLTHTLVGAALAQSGLNRATPLATTTLLIAVNLPDIDIIYAMFGESAYLEGHRGITHSVFGFPVLALAFGLCVYAYSRLIRERLHPGCEPARPVALAALGLLGVATHPLLDYTNAYGWRPFLPVDDRWAYIDLAFVVDPWIWIGLGGALYWATANNRRRQAGWLGLFALQSAVLVMTWLGSGAPGHISGAAVGVWFVLVAAVVGVKLVIKVDAARARRISLGALLALGLYFAALAVLQTAAVFLAAEAAHVAISPNEQVTAVDALPTEADPMRWRAVVSTEESFYLADLHLLGNTEPRFERYARETGNADLIEQARSKPKAETFLRFARFPVARVLKDGERSGEVEFEDLRFAGPRNRFRVRERVGDFQ